MSTTAAAEKPDRAAAMLFGLLCLAWGSTWLALKTGVATVPPLTFAAARFLLAALPLLGWAAARRRLRVPLATVLPGAVLMIAANYGLMAWGAVRVPAGLAAAVNLGTVPLATLLLGVAHGQSRWSAAVLGAVLAGAAGLLLLLATGTASSGAVGVAAIAGGAAAYAWGTVLTKGRPAADPVALAGWQALAGGALLAAAAAISEPVALAPLAAAPALLSLAILVLAGSVLGGAAYLALLARWDAGRVAAYAFVCPVIALAESAAAGADLPGPRALAAVLLLLLASAGSLSQARRS